MNKINYQNKLVAILDDEIKDLEYQLFHLNCLTKAVRKSVAKKKKERKVIQSSVLDNDDSDDYKEDMINRHKKLNGGEVDERFQEELDEYLEDDEEDED